MRKFRLVGILLLAFGFAHAQNTVTQTFTSAGAGTFTVPSGITNITVECWGAGGGGGAGNGTNQGGAGGGGGGAYSRSSLSVTAGSYSYNVGAAGIGGNNNTVGANGGDSWFSSASTIIAKGGIGGDCGGGSCTHLGGSGGNATAGIGLLKFSGGSGGTGWNGGGGGSSQSGGGGGSSASITGSGTNGGNSTGSLNGGIGGFAPTGGGNGGNGGDGQGGPQMFGYPGNSPGGGGGGSGKDIIGGNGANGQITISYTVPSILSVNIPNTSMKIGDVVTATISVVSDPSTFTLTSGSVDNFPLSNLIQVNSSTYTAQFTVTAGGTDIAAASSIPVSIVFTDNNGNSNAAYTTPISQAADPIDANAPATPSMPDLDPADDSGLSAVDNITSIDANLTFTGTAEPGSTISYRETTLGTLGSVTTSAGGTYSFDIDLPDGSYSIFCGATDGAGNSSPTSGILNFTVDTGNPTVTVNQSPAPQTDPTSTLPVKFTIVFSEAIDPGSFVAGDILVTGPGASVTNLQSTDNINWVATVTATAPGVITASLGAGACSDIAGNTNAASASTDNSITYISCSPPILTPSSVGNTSCGTPNGSVLVTASTSTGEPSSYTVKWYTGNVVSAPNEIANNVFVTGSVGFAATGLASGNYTAQVINNDDATCSNTTTTFVVDNTSFPNVTSLSSTPNTGCTIFNGTATAVPTTPGGEPTGGYSYQWYDNLLNQVGTANPITALAPGTYSVIAKNNDSGCQSSSAFVAITDNSVIPTITLGASPSVTQGATTTSLPYTGTTGSPNQYTIDFDATAQGQGFVDVAFTTLPASPITITVPAGAAVATYNATISVKSSTTGCTGVLVAFTVQVLTGPPTVQATNITFSSIATTSLTLNWTNGNGTSRIVLAKQGSTVSSTPLANNSYTANSVFGSGTQIGTGNYVVYSGTGTSASVTGLTAGTTYFFQVFEFNGTAGSGTEQYNTSSNGSNPASSSTMFSQPTTQASAIIFNNVTSTSMDVSWTNGNGTSRFVMAKVSNTSSFSPVDGTVYTSNTNFTLAPLTANGDAIVYLGSGNSFTLTGLTASTTYAFKIFEFNGSGVTANYMSTGPNGNQLTSSTANTTIAGLTTGVAPSPLSSSATNQAVLGFSMTSNGTQTLTAVDVQLTSAPTGVLQNWSLVKSTDNSFSTAGDNTVVTGITITPISAPPHVSITGLSQSITATPNNYFLVADVNAAVTGATPAMQASLGSSNATVSSGTLSGSATGTNYSFTAADVTPPTITSIVGATGSPTNQSIISWQATFSEAVNNVDALDFTYSVVSGSVTVANLAVSPVSSTLYNITANSVSGSGVLRIDMVASASITDLASNSISTAAFTSGSTITVDQTPPTIVSLNTSAGQANPTNISPISFTVVFSEAINLSTFVAGDILTGGGAGGQSVSNLSSTDNITWTFTVSATSSGNVSPSLNTGAVNDMVGNSLSNSMSATATFDNVAPVFSAVAPASSSTVNNTQVSYTLSELIASGTITWTRTGGAADGTVHTQTLTGIELTSGVHSNITLTNNPTLVSGAIYTIAFAGTDAAGNTAAVVTNTSVTFDNTAPVFSATAPASSSSVNNTKVSYTLSEAISSGTITWTRTGGTADGTVHTQSLTGTELATGVHSNITLTNNPTLVNGTIYSVAFTGTDAAGNNATAVTNTNVTFDNSAPTVVSVSLQTPATSPTNSSSLIFRVIFSENVTGVTSTDFTTTVSGVTASPTSVATVSATTYDVTVSATGNGTVRLDVLNTATINDVAGNAYASNFTTGQVYTVDQTAPVFSSTAPATNATVSTTQVSYTLSEAIASGSISWTRTGGTNDGGSPHTQPLTGSELTVGAHTNITLTNNPTLVSGTIYTVNFNGQDAAGNAATQVSNTNVTFSTATPPVITAVTIPNVSMKIGDVVTATITVNSNTEVFTLGTSTIDGFALGNLVKSSNTSYTAQFTVIAGGTDVAAASNIPISVMLVGVAGNGNTFTTAIAQAGDPIDAHVPATPAAPDLATASDSGTSSTDNLTNVTTNIVFSGVAGSTENNSTVKIFDGSTQVGSSIASGTGAWSLSVASLTSGAHTMTVTATDAAGNASTASALLVVTIDNTPPAFSATAPASGTSVSNTKVSYTLSEAIASGAITWTNTGGVTDATVHSQSLTGTELTIGAHNAITLTNNPTLVSGSIYSVAFSGSDVAGNNATVLTNTNVTFDNAAPTVVSIALKTPVTSPTNASTVTFTVTFSENVTGVGSADFTKTGSGVTSGTVTVSGTGSSYDVSIASVQGNGTLGISLLNGTAVLTDLAGNSFSASFTSGAQYTIDTTAPTFTPVTPASSALVSNSNISYTLSEAIVSGTVTWTRTGGTADPNAHVQTLSGSDLTLGAHSLTNGPVLVSGSIYTVAFSGTDAAGNVGTASSTSITVDNTPPVVQSIVFKNPLNALTNASSLTFTVVFSESVINVDGGDFTGNKKTTSLAVGGATVTGSGTTYDVTFTVGGSGTLQLDVLSTATIVDAVGNAYTSNFTSGPEYTVDKTPPVFSNTTPISAATVHDTKVSYTLSEDLNIGTITWKQTGGTTDPNIHVQSLTGSELTNGVHSSFILSSPPTLVAGSVYELTFSGTDLAGNPATDVKIIGITYTPTADNLSDVIASANFSYPQGINYASYQEAADIQNSGTSIAVASFTIRDGGANAPDGDPFPTILTGINIDLGANAAFFRRAALYDANGQEIASSEKAVSGTSISLSTISISCDDNSTASFTVRVSFKTAVIDNQKIILSITAVTADKDNSQFASADGGAAISSNATGVNVISVNATKLEFVLQPSNTFINEVMAPAVMVQTVDDNGNLDMDYTGTASFTSTGTMSGSPKASLISGIGASGDIVHTASGNGLTLTGSANGLTDAVSNTFDIYENTSDIKLDVHTFITPNTIDEKNNVLVIENIEFFTENTVKLIDRWGIPVKTWKNFVNYSTTNPDQDDFDFTSLAVGNYVCIVEFKDSTSGKKRNHSQMITVLK